MKKILTIIVVIVTALTISKQTDSAEPKFTRPDKATVDKQNFPNYWDAKAWDREGGNSFWHRLGKKKNMDRPTPKETKNGSVRR